MANTTSPARKLAELALGESLENWVGERRGEQPQRSWRSISVELRDKTNGMADFAPETLRLWFPEQNEEQAV